MAKTFISALEAECVIFDLDGTLVDTAPDLLATLNVLLGELGRRPLTLPEIKSAIGLGAKALLRNGANLTGEPLSEDQIEALFVKYIAYYSAHIADHTTPFPGAVEVLEACREAGVKLAVCTNKLDSLSHQVLAALRLDGYFDAVIGSDTLGVQKPDPETVLEILRRTGASPEKTLFVGDSQTDLETARAAGVAVVLVDYGYSATPARELTPDAVISDLREIL
ncbi:MAG: HAD-IA family hydrolase [Proteobacteria bacterium]|nr:HAD-IA family hydrolase [Pseudomonadota bacterium]